MELYFAPSSVHNGDYNYYHAKLQMSAKMKEFNTRNPSYYIAKLKLRAKIRKPSTVICLNIY